MQAQHFFQKAGLDQHQIEVYLALIVTKEATAGQLSQRTGVPRTYTYKVLEDLIEMGFVQTDHSRSIRCYSLTDLEAPKRYIERQQLELYQLQQEAQQLSHQLESLAHPQVPMPVVEELRGAQGEEDFWRLLHSTLTREIWVVHPPVWWGQSGSSTAVEKWENYRVKQHIWEKRLAARLGEEGENRFVEYVQLASTGGKGQASLFLVDHYQVQVTSWDPFRAVRIESSEMIDVFKGMVG